MFADEALEKFFGQARQRSAGNFYIDVVDIKAAAETKNLRALLKYDSTPQPYSDVPCTCSIHIEEDQFDITILETEDLVQSNDTIKHKVIFIAGYLERKFRTNISTAEAEDDDDNLTDSEFLTNLNRGGLTVPLISTVHFVHSAYKLFVNCNLHCCRAHLSQALSRIDSAMSIIQGACVTLSNILLKSFVLDNSDKERQLGCLRGRKNSHLKTKLQ